MKTDIWVTKIAFDKNPNQVTGETFFVAQRVEVYGRVFIIWSNEGLVRLFNVHQVAFMKRKPYASHKGHMDM